MLGNTFDQVIDLTTTEAANHPLVQLTACDQIKDGLATSTTVSGGKSTITV